MGDGNNYTEYISKLIDRNLKKNQSNGFTLWAIIGVLFYLTFDLFDKTPAIILEWPHPKLYPFLIIIVTINLLLFTIGCLGSLDSVYVKQKRKLQTQLNNSNIVLYVAGFLLFVLGLLNYRIKDLPNDKIGLTFPFYLAGFYFSGIGFYPYIEKGSDLWRMYRTKTSVLCFNSSMLFARREIAKANLIILPILIVIFLYYVVTVETPLEIEEVFDSVKIAIEITAFFALVIIFITKFLELKKNRWLENLEQEIYMLGLNDDEIQQRLEKEYIGQSVENWFSEEQTELEVISNLFEEQYDIINKHINKIYLIQQSLVDNQFQNIRDKNQELNEEYDWIENESKAIMDTILQSYNIHVMLSNKINSKLDTIITKPDLEEQERQEINRIGNHYSKLQETIKEKHSLIQNEWITAHDAFKAFKLETSKKREDMKSEEPNSKNSSKI